MSNFKYDPKITSKPGEPLEVSVEIPEGPDGRESEEDVFAAIDEAARLVFGDDFMNRP